MNIPVAVQVILGSGITTSERSTYRFPKPSTKSQSILTLTGIQHLRDNQGFRLLPTYPVDGEKTLGYLDGTAIGQDPKLPNMVLVNFPTLDDTINLWFDSDVTPIYVRTETHVLYSQPIKRAISQSTQPKTPRGQGWFIPGPITTICGTPPPDTKILQEEIQILKLREQEHLLKISSLNKERELALDVYADKVMEHLTVVADYERRIAELYTREQKILAILADYQETRNTSRHNPIPDDHRVGEGQ